MTVAIRKVLPEEVEELKVISEDTFRETFAHDNTESQLQAYFDTALSEEVLLDEITHEESRYFFILVDGEKAGFLKTNVGSAQTEQHLDNAFQIQRIYISQAFQGMGLGKQLFEFALQEARDLGCDWAWLGWVFGKGILKHRYFTINMASKNSQNTIFQLVTVK